MAHKAKMLTILYNYLLSMKALLRGNSICLIRKKSTPPCPEEMIQPDKATLLERKGQKDAVFPFRLE